MGLKKYTFVPAKNGEAAHYVDENGVKITGIKSTKPILVYDEDNKKYLDDLHAQAYLETLIDDDESDEVEFDEENPSKNNETKNKETKVKPIAGVDVTKLVLEPDKDELAVQELLTEINNNEDSKDIQVDTELFKFFGFTKSKDFTKQSLSSSDFQKGIKKMYQKFTIGFRVKDISDENGLPNISAYPISEWLSLVGRAIGYQSIKKDKDTRVYQNKLAKQEREQELEIQENEQELENQQESKNMNVELIYNEELVFDIPEYRKNKFLNEERSLIDPYTQLEIFKKLQKAIMGPLLGYGNPAGANIQFLDQNALKNGEYKYNYKAIKNFTDKSFIKDKEALSFITDQMRYKEFKAEDDEIKIGYKKEYEFNDVIDFNDVRYLSSEDRTKALKDRQNELVISSAKEYNKSIFDKTNSYFKLMAIKECRSKFYSFWHPFESRKQNKLLASMKQEIINSLIPNTDFANNITDWLNSRIGGDGAKNYKNMAKANIDEIDDPKKANAYIDYIKGDVKITNIPGKFYRESVIDLMKEDIKKDTDKFTLSKAPEKVKENVKDLDIKRPHDPKLDPKL